MTYDLFPHQDRGASFLAESEGTKGLFYGMGTGKTVTGLEGYRRTPASRMLIIGPPISLPMWLREAQSYLSIGDNVSCILKTGTAPIKPGCIVLVVSYAIAAKRADELREWLATGASVLICDESHALKNGKAKRTKAILGAGGIADGAAYTWLLTGTPITRWNDDMLPFLQRADPEGMKAMCGGLSEEKFLLRYTIRQKRQFPGARWPVQMVIGNRNTEELAEWIYGADGGEILAQRVDLKEVFENMPPLTHNRYEVKLDTTAMGEEAVARLKELEKQSLSDIRAQLESKEPALATVRREMGLGMVKPAVAELVERRESGERVLVGAWHTDVVDALVEALRGKGYTAARIDGRDSSARKTDVETTWNSGGFDFVVGQIAAMGVSLNMQQGGSQIIVVEEDWSPAIMDQFYARLWRYGQEKHVHVDTLTNSSKLAKALGRISSTKDREQTKFNKVGQAVTDAKNDVIGG